VPALFRAASRPPVRCSHGSEAYPTVARPTANQALAVILPWLLSIWACAWSASAVAASPITELRAAWATAIARRLSLPDDEGAAYAARLDVALRSHGLTDLPPQFFVLVDRSPRVQAMFLYWGDSAAGLHPIGSAPCSTGKPGRYEYFETPLGVFPHTMANPDFRAEGTLNDQGIRGYGIAGMRVFDFGWVTTPRGWGDRHLGQMRLQMHATDPDALESRLGTACSKGCIRIPAEANVFIDRLGILDADYDRALAEGRAVWQLRSDRTPTPWSGRYLVVVESTRAERPFWTMQPPVHRTGRPGWPAPARTRTKR